jgi:hypothetical protein
MFWFIGWWILRISVVLSYLESIIFNGIIQLHLRCIDHQKWSKSSDYLLVSTCWGFICCLLSKMAVQFLCFYWYGKAMLALWFIFKFFWVLSIGTTTNVTTFHSFYSVSSWPISILNTFFFYVWTLPFVGMEV